MIPMADDTPGPVQPPVNVEGPPDVHIPVAEQAAVPHVTALLQEVLRVQGEQGQRLAQWRIDLTDQITHLDQRIANLEAIRMRPDLQDLWEIQDTIAELRITLNVMRGRVIRLEGESDRQGAILQDVHAIVAPWIEAALVPEEPEIEEMEIEPQADE